MNVNPGGKQRVMRDEWWNRQPQRMNYAVGVPKGMRMVLEERGISTHLMNADQMREVLRGHLDFLNEKSTIECFLVEDRGHVMCMLPKFHCELNTIERIWAQVKQYARAYCKYNIRSLRNTISSALDSVTIENMQNQLGITCLLTWKVCLGDLI